MPINTPNPKIKAALENNGLIDGNQYISAAFNVPNPIPINPANNAIGAIIFNCSMAIFRVAIPSGVKVKPGAIKSINGVAKMTNPTVTINKIIPTNVETVSTKASASLRSRFANALIIAL